MFARESSIRKQYVHRKKILNYLKSNWQLYCLLILPLSYFLIFKYLPMYGVIIAFKEFNIFQGVMKSPWIGLDVFKEVFSNKEFYQVLRNTLVLNFLDLVFSFPAPIILAIMLNEVRIKWVKKTTQTIIYLPHFISWVIIGGMTYQLFSTSTGMVNILLKEIGGKALPFLSDKWWWIAVYVFTGIWQSAGWGTILYLAALTNINKELYEAAFVDGANRIRRTWHITLPGLRPTIAILLILQLGKVVQIGFERPFVMGNMLVSEFSEVLSTYVYRVGLQTGRYNLATAVGLFQSVIGLIFLVSINYLVKKMGEEGIW